MSPTQPTNGAVVRNAVRNALRESDDAEVLDAARVRIKVIMSVERGGWRRVRWSFFLVWRPDQPVYPRTADMTASTSGSKKNLGLRQRTLPFPEREAVAWD